jgi:spore germination cell wall hydrolase CwlJ-like protein
VNTWRVRGKRFDLGGKRARWTAAALRALPLAFAFVTFAAGSAMSGTTDAGVPSAATQPPNVSIAAETAVMMAESVPTTTVAVAIHPAQLFPKTAEASDSVTLLASDIEHDLTAATEIRAIAATTETRRALAPIPASQAPPMWDLALAELNGTRSPAQRLRLDAKARAREEACLAQAIYYEARGETLRGQLAVAQVVMNRVFSRFYPGGVCEVVYQNAHRRNACQFSFACDGKRKLIKDRRAWAVAEYVATLAFDGKIWEPDIDKATHYHAVWVNPWWVGTMRKLASHGVHIFYRPIRWGDGSDEPDWSEAATRTSLAALN